ncbi:MAG TPA: flagellar hook-length control protein FliK, partial [Acetobacteraceae bacterium]
MKSVPASGSAKPPPDPGKPLAAAALSQHAVSEEKSSPLLDAARTGPAAGAAARDFAAHVASDERSGQTGGQPNPIDAPTLAGAVPTQSPASASPPQVAHSTPAAASPDAAAQVAPAVVSLVQTGDGGQRLVLHLQPAELGQVQVRIDRTDGAPARVEITVQRPETAQMLLRDQSQLQHALDQAGIPQDG